MSCEHTINFLERCFEEGLEQGMSDSEAESYARERLSEEALIEFDNKSIEQ